MGTVARAPLGSLSQLAASRRKEGEPARFNEPGLFVLDDDGALFWSSIATMPFGRPALDDVLAGLRFAQEHDYPARGAA